MNNTACRAIIFSLYMILTGALLLKLEGASDPAREPIQIEYGDWPAAPTGTPPQIIRAGSKLPCAPGWRKI
jgi:hypothetical protein